MFHKDDELHSGKMGASKIVVNDSGLDTTHPDIFEVTGSREEITLFFGSVHSFDAEEKRVSAMLSTRIILSPIIAKRIAALLDKKVSEYESIHGTVMPDEPMRFTAGQSSLLYVPSPDKVDDEGAGNAIRLMRLVDGLNTDYAYERSYKLARGSILRNRFLFGINKNRVGMNAEKALVSVCEQLGMPPQFLDQFKENLDPAKCVHFGFEENDNGCMYKVYLEFDVNLKPEAAGADTMPDPFLLHLGFKWSVNNNTNRALSRYTCYPFLSTEDILKRISAIYCDSHHGKAKQFATRILDAAVKRMPEHKFLYMEVKEDDNPRMSFDLKLYEANLLMREIRPLMDDILAFYEIPSDRFDAVNEPAGEKFFGHLSGGIDRNGQDFITIYYGVEWR